MSYPDDQGAMSMRQGVNAGLQNITGFKKCYSIIINLLLDISDEINTRDNTGDYYKHSSVTRRGHPRYIIQTRVCFILEAR